MGCCNNGCGGGSCLWIIIILIILFGCGGLGGNCSSGSSCGC
jgi:hypothetical protein